ncbi:Slx4p interacting protein [Rhodotorula toruloides]
MPRASSPALAARRSSNPSTSTSALSTILNHSIPPFYACYLLKSYNVKRPHMTYIGSTPDPPRRFKQHMGDRIGGAIKTRFGRPWEMEAIVHGFPSKLQALQFEWCWQKPESSRLLRRPAPPPDPDADPNSSLAPKKRKTTSTAPPKTVPQFPRRALSHRALARIQVLQYMLTVPPWSRFDLSVTLFSEQAREWWDQGRRMGPVVRTEAEAKKWEKQRQEDEDAWGVEKGSKLDSVKVHYREEGVDGERLVRQGKQKEGDGSERMRVDDDDFFHFHWDKFLSLTTSNDSPNCYICRKPIDTEDHLSFHLCTAPPSAPASPPCLATFHPLCLSAHFLSTASSPSSSTSTAPLLPTTSSCPSCLSDLHWTDLVRGMYRRKEESEGRRKKRVRQMVRKGTRVEEDGGIEGEEDEEVEGGKKASPKKRGRKKKVAEAGDAGEPVKKPRAKAGVKGKKASAKTAASKKGKGKGKAATPASSDAGEEFYFSDLPSDADLDAEDGGAARDEDVGFDFDEDDSDVERSFVRMDAAFDANLGDEALFSDDQEDGDLDLQEAIAAFEPAKQTKKPRAKKTALSPVPASPKRRGRPPKATSATVAALSDDPPSPPKKRRTKATTSSSSATLLASFSTTKASAAATKLKGRKAKSASLSLSESEEELPPPAALGKAAAKRAASPKARKKKAVEYVELSD